MKIKAVVVEIKGNKAVFLSDDGRFAEQANKNYRIGQEVEYTMKKNISFKKFAAYAAAACVLLVAGAGLLTYNMPSAYVSLDVNPAVEYTVNMYDRVLSVRGVNEDGTEIIREIELDSLKNQPIETAISMTVDEIAKLGYLDSEGSGVVIAASARDPQKSGELAVKLEDAANEALERNSLERTASAEAVGRERVEEAKKLGVTPGKLNLVEKLKAGAPDPDSIDINDWLDRSVKDIMAQTKENKEQNRERNNDKGDKSEGSENGSENGKPETTGEGSSDGSENNENNGNNGKSDDDDKGNGKDDGKGDDKDDDKDDDIDDGKDNDKDDDIDEDKDDDIDEDKDDDIDDDKDDDKDDDDIDENDDKDNGNGNDGNGNGGNGGGNGN